MGGLAAAVALACLTGCASAPAQQFLTTKTPYQPRQAPGSYTPVPPGFAPLQTQLVARHGARAMTGMKDDLALLNMCRQAEREHALTPLGQALLKDVERLIHVQLLLGSGIEGIAKPGYANLSQVGIDEHRQLALRLLQRQPGLFAAPDARTIVVQHSGVDRARDSAYFFTRSLTQAQPALAARIEAPVEGSVNRSGLYFHKLNAAQDGVIAPGDPRFGTWQASLRYQQYLRSPGLQARLDAIEQDPRLDQAARIVLERLFSKDFVDRLAGGQLRFSNSGRMDAVSADGKWRAGRDGDGKTTLESPRDALMALSSVVEIAPGLRVELGEASGRAFSQYIPDEQAQLLSWANDAEDFFTKGPAAARDAPVTYEMAQGLLRDFFNEAEEGSKRHLAVLRFTHAEILIPMASLLGVAGSTVPLAAGQSYTYATNPWRGSEVAPYAANIQWDSFSNPQGTVLVRMLYNEKETPFKPACDSARFSPGSYFYEMAALRRCYLGTPAAH